VPHDRLVQMHVAVQLTWTKTTQSLHRLDFQSAIPDAHTVRPPSRLPLAASLGQHHARLRPFARHWTSRLRTAYKWTRPRVPCAAARRSPPLSVLTCLAPATRDAQALRNAKHFRDLALHTQELMLLSSCLHPLHNKPFDWGMVMMVASAVGCVALYYLMAPARTKPKLN